MSIEIKITDPYAMHAAELQHLAAFLVSIAEAREEFCASTGAVPTKPARIHTDDNPAAGEEVPNPAEIFAGGGNPAEVFAGGANPAEVFGGGHGSAELDADAAKLNALAGPGAAGLTLGNLAAAGSLPTASGSAVVSAPAQSTALAPVPSGPVIELDSAGLPWDGRIHAESRAKIKKDDTWKKRRGVDDATVAAVEAELRAVLAAPGVAGNVPPPPPAVPHSVPPAPPVSSAAAMIAPPASTAIASSPNPAAPAVAVSPIVAAAGVVAPVPPAPANPGNVPPPPPPAPPANGAPAVSTATPIAPATSPATATPVGNAPAPSITFPQLLPKVTLALAQKTLSDERVKQVLEHYKLPSIPSLAMRADLVQPVHDALFGAA